MNFTRGVRLGLGGAGCLLAGCASSPQAGPDVRDHGRRVVRVAVCQTLCIDSDVEGNLRRIGDAVAEAARQGADVACFAETCVIGWINPDAHALAEPIPGPLSDRIAAMARRHEVMIAIGISERDGDALYDSAVLIGADGEVLLKHRKINVLAELLDPPYTRGLVEGVGVVQTPIGRVGMLICADTFVEENVAAAGAQSPDLMLIPYGWAADSGAWPEHGESLAAWVSSVASRTGCPVVGTDLVGTVSKGPWAGKTYGGQSVVADGNGRVIDVLQDRVPEVRVFEILVGGTDEPADP